MCVCEREGCARERDREYGLVHKIRPAASPPGPLRHRRNSRSRRRRQRQPRSQPPPPPALQRERERGSCKRERERKYGLVHKIRSAASPPGPLCQRRVRRSLHCRQPCSPPGPGRRCRRRRARYGRREGNCSAGACGPGRQRGPPPLRRPQQMPPLPMPAWRLWLPPLQRQ